MLASVVVWKIDIGFKSSRLFIPAGPLCQTLKIRGGLEAAYWEGTAGKQSEWSVANGVVTLLLCLPAGQHRGLGTMVSKVQSLKLDTSVWSNEIVQVGVAVRRNGS